MSFFILAGSLTSNSILDRCYHIPSPVCFSSSYSVCCAVYFFFCTSNFIHFWPFVFVKCSHSKYFAVTVRLLGPLCFSFSVSLLPFALLHRWMTNTQYFRIQSPTIFAWAISINSSHTHTEQTKRKKPSRIAGTELKKKIAASRLILHINIDFLPIMFRRPKRSELTASARVRKKMSIQEQPTCRELKANYRSRKCVEKRKECTRERRQSKELKRIIHGMIGTLPSPSSKGTHLDKFHGEPNRRSLGAIINHQLAFTHFSDSEKWMNMAAQQQQQNQQ